MLIKNEGNNVIELDSDESDGSEFCDLDLDEMREKLVKELFA